MVWATHDYSYEEVWLMEQLVTSAEQLAELPQTDEIRALHCRLLATQGIEMEGAGDAAAMAAAQSAVVEARELADPSALGYALDGLARQLMGNGTWDERRPSPTRCSRSRAPTAWPGHRGLAHFLLEQAALAVGDLAAAEEHGRELEPAGAGVRAARARRRVPPGARRGGAGPRRPRRGAARGTPSSPTALRSIGAFSVDALEWIAAWLIAYQAGRAEDGAGAGPGGGRRLPAGRCRCSSAACCRPGRTDEARAAHAGRPRPRRDLLRSMFAALDAENALDLDDGVEAAYDELLPCAGELGGGASGFFVVGPVDTVLARLAHRLGRPDAARARTPRPPGSWRPGSATSAGSRRPTACAADVLAAD